MSDVDRYRSNLFVRTVLIEKIFEWCWQKVDGLGSGEIAQIFWLLGPAESGKSWLAAHLVQEAQSRPNERTCLLVLGQDCPLDTDYVLHLPPLEQTTPNDSVRKVQTWLAESLKVAGHVTALNVDQAIEQLLSVVEDEQPLLILIDGVDEAREDFLRVLENYLIAPFYTRYSQISFFLVGRQFHRWTSFKLRQFDAQADVKTLQPFPKPAIYEVLECRDISVDLAAELDEAFELGAYPGHIVEVFRNWQTHPDLCQTLELMVQSMWKVSNLTLPLVYGLNLANRNSNLFTRGDLKEIFEQRSDFGDLINRLMDARILHWNSSRERYEMDAAYRQLFKLYSQRCQSV